VERRSNPVGIGNASYGRDCSLAGSGVSPEPLVLANVVRDRCKKYVVQARRLNLRLRHEFRVILHFELSF